MKVLHFISGGDTGGAKTQVITLLKRLKGLGAEVELLCIMEGVFTKEAREAGVSVKIIPQNKRYDVTVLRKITEYINKGGYDLVHCHGARANYITLFIKNKVKIPMVTTMHSDYKLDFKGSWYKQMVYMPINYFALKKFKYILTMTQTFKNMLVSRGFKEERIFVIYNGIDFEKKLEVMSRESFFYKHGIKYDPSKSYVGIAARLTPVKGVQNFLDAAVKILKECDDIRFLIAGDGEEFEKHKAFIEANGLSDKIFMLGFVADIENFYNAIDVNALTSLSEGFPYVLLEGARMRKATVSTDVGGIAEIIKDGETGYLVKPSDNLGLAEKIKKLAFDKDLNKKLGEAFFKDTSERFSDKKMTETYMKIYEKVVKEN